MNGEESRVQDRWIDEAKRGDGEALSALLVAFYPLMRRNARLLSGEDRFLRDDLVQEGHLALCRALLGYDRDRGPFPAYAKRCVRNGMISFLRTLPRETPEDTESLEGVLSRRTGPDWERIERLDALDRLRERLSRAELQVLDAYLRGGSVARAVTLLGWDRKRVDNALCRVRAKAREIAGER
jgi:RNA polymerase sporulation-specific sigma factor